MTEKTVDDVKHFWNSNPLWSGESKYEVGSLEFFDEHRSIVLSDCLAGDFDARLLPPPSNRSNILDLGCGIGFWTIELSQWGCTNITAADLSETAIDLCRLRCNLNNVNANFSLQNAERMTFEDGSFAHVNCQGVIHHTPDSEACVREIARVLRANGSASISVYYQNFFLRNWSFFKPISSLCAKYGGRLCGRGRESIMSCKDAEEIVRLYDGADNPIGKSYSKRDFLDILNPYFHVRELFLHFFPARTLPIKIPKMIHRFLDQHFGFMIYANLIKR